VSAISGLLDSVKSHEQPVVSPTPLLSEADACLDGSVVSQLLSESRTVAVGWSGGADSTLLLLALHSVGCDVQAWHIDHAWHTVSADHAKQLEQQAEVWQIPFRSVRLKQPATNNRESVARAGRYRAFEGLAEETGVRFVCLGHHLLDQAETVCMRMLQGAGVHGICGMHAVRPRGSVTLCRPLLHLPRSAIVSVLKGAGIEWHDDPSNEDVTLWRNRLRKEFFPEIERAGHDPVTLFMRWQRQAEVVTGLIQDALDPIEIKSDEQRCWVAWQVWQEQTPLLRIYLLQRMMQNLFGEGVVAGRRHIEQVAAWMEKGGQGGLDLSRSRLMRKDGRLQLCRKD